MFKQIQRLQRLTAILFLGFASGLPLALTGQAMQAWLTTDGVAIATIGFLALVGMPYTFKFLWAPLMDRFEPSWLGRRRGWLVLTQLFLAVSIYYLSTISYTTSPATFAVIALLVTFLSASQDIVIDAYRTDVLEADERGIGASMSVLGYRMGMILSGGIALIWADQWQSWSRVYQMMAGVMLFSAIFSLVFLPTVKSEIKPLNSDPKKELLGFLALLLGVLAGVYVTRFAFMAAGIDFAEASKWVQLAYVLVSLSVALPMGVKAAQYVGFATLTQSLSSYFNQKSAWAFLILIILYKLGDAFAGSLFTPFLLKGMLFTQIEVGIVNKIIGIWLTIIGAFLAGLLMMRFTLFQALMSFGVLQLLSNFGFYALAILGKGAWGSFTLMPFDLGFVAVTVPTQIDSLLMSAIALENITSGMGTAAFVALLMSLCSNQFSATHYALLSALAAVGRIYVSPVAGVLSESLGWPNFFLFSVVTAVPGVVMLWWMRESVYRISQKHIEQKSS
ncbi:MAG: MFS transporter [Methylotenera sp.]|nr:MFS transporter [Methylotenera sp.]